LPVDPGAYIVEATAPARLPWRATIDVSTARPSWEAHVPELELPASSPVTAETSPWMTLPSPIAAHGPSSSSSKSDGINGMQIAALSAAAGSVLAFGASGYFTYSAITDNGAAEPHCRGSMCDRTGADLRESAVAAGDMATAMIITGGAMLVTGTIFWLLNPSRSERR
jgi:hypothetical protein